MKRVTWIATAMLLTVLAVWSGRLAAQETNTQERTFLTFSGAVEMPGVTLQPGTYVFKLADTSSRNVVQVFDKDEKDILGQWLFVQAERPEVTGDTVIMFKEQREGTTPAVQYWYFPGEKIGKEFVYPKDQALKIAQRTGQDVKSTEGEITATSSVTSVDAKGNVTEWKKESASASASAPPAPSPESAVANAPAPAQPTAAAGSLAGNRGVREEPQAAPESQIAQAPAPAPAPEPERTEPARPVGTSGQASAQDRPAPAQTAPAQAAPARELPATASPLALSGLIGLLSLAGAAGLRFWR